ncbi:glycosyltransferase [Glutamicibacter ardleyensis]|uniref:glycosyltransferase n=1 Tax=Glutamicibacter ardleyensis TaxID=225894 RepID=UPI003FD3AE8D
MNQQIVANVVVIFRLVASNLKDDPSYFALQVARRFKTKRAIKGLQRILTGPKSPKVFVALGAMIGDDADALSTVCNAWLRDKKSATGAVFLANLCISSGNWGLAERLLVKSKDSVPKKRAQARLAWALGHMAEAIQILDQIPDSRQKRHYISEAAVFRGTDPVVSIELNEKIVYRKRNSVLFLATNSLPHTGSGYAQRTQSVLSSLAKKGWSVSAATRVQYPLNIGRISSALKDKVGVVEYERLLPRMPRHDMMGRVQQQADELYKKVVRDRPAILHTTTDFSNALAVRAVAETTGIPWVYEVRGQLADTWLSTRPSDSKNSERYRLFMEREASVAKAADHVFTLGKAMRDNLILAGVDEDKISLLPNGIGEKFIDAPMPRVEARLELGLTEDAFYVGTVSSLVPYEGLSTVIEAMAQLTSEFPHLLLLIVGDGTERENLIKLADNLGIAERCVFPGRVPREQAHLYHAALDVFVVPRVDSAVTRSVTPLKPVEAMASNVPVLASDLPALQEIVTDGENGHLVKPGDASDWAKYIRRLILNPKAAHDMGTSGRDFVLRNRTWDQNAQHIVEVYERVINKAL